ncbi:complement C1q-like protein 2 [Anneissia japonica]|uniref:complement C1q-like protein 2 n=1 Tax=Anneissia japonica TaxID=1529436 RepID=UPI0014258FD7|nr:complement C1q-like protein 2 [Anneissia japonica]
MLVAGKPTDRNFLTDDVDLFIANGGEGSGNDLVLPVGSLYKSAFTAKLTTGLDSLWFENRRIVFDSVLTSVGNDYNPKDGRFTTSISGTYVFSLSLMSKYSSGSSAFGCLQKNDVEQICVWSNGNSAHEMSSNTITLNLKKGDVVNVILKGGSYGLHNYGEAGYCSFSGFLLYPEESPLDKILAAINIS